MFAQRRAAPAPLESKAVFSQSSYEHSIRSMKTISDERDSSVPREPAGRRVLAELAGMSPAYFGMVMATGIVSLAAHLLGVPRIAQALFQFNIFVYAVLWFLTVLRMARHPHRFFGDMVDHLRGPGFFTTVAATGVLGASSWCSRPTIAQARCSGSRRSCSGSG